MTTQSTRRSFSQILLGPPLETAAAPHQAIGKIPGLAVFASDALSSVAYATEEILVVLALAGAAFFHLSIPVALGISTLLLILTISYRQTIFAYPGGGGAYIVARDNLGELAAQTAGAALMTDYILTVAVSISSGVAQITSAFPAVYPFRVELAVALIIFMTLVNLRGVKESSTAFAIPTYFFLVTAFVMILVGFYRWFAGTLPPVTHVEMIQRTVQPLTLFLILRAFSSGCTAVTGVEAISNGITAFKEPRSRNAATTLLAMAGILMTLFLSITFLANHIHALPSDTETVISQLARTIYGEGPLYLVTLAATTVILIMAANTSFADFPRLGALHAGDGFLPRQLTFRGSRLVFSWGIVSLAAVAAFLIIIFQASVSALIPLYAIGVFLSFTMSQAGMVVRWRRISRLQPGQEIQHHESILRYDPHWRVKQAVNALGAVVTGTVMLVFAITKFHDGAWVIILLTPTLVYLFFRIHHHYRAVSHQLSLEGVSRTIGERPVLTIVLVDNLHAASIRAINFAISLRQPWTAVHISIDETRTARLQTRWQERCPSLPLVVLPSPYRSLTEPLLAYIAQLRQDSPDAYIHLIFGGLTTETFWEQALHQNSAVAFRLALRHIEGVAITNVAFQLHHHPTEQDEAAIVVSGHNRDGAVSEQEEAYE
ncbi:MAG: APC family permease [Anaerolineales bacterium]|nr:APC family permease [Anaerolineales bacterium]